MAKEGETQDLNSCPKSSFPSVILTPGEGGGGAGGKGSGMHL